MMTMNTPAAAWYNGKVLLQVGFAKPDVENYRAVYCKVFDWPAKAATFAGTGSQLIEMAVEDALFAVRIDELNQPKRS